MSQEQFDKYVNINTDDLVKKVKDLLSKFSISQRLFGECILGLSQGSVSDLLARPKPWVMLTQKGREPFIRMQMFIEDSDAVKKLMANQYKTPQTDKYVRPNETSTPLLTPCSLKSSTGSFLHKSSPFNSSQEHFGSYRHHSLSNSSMQNYHNQHSFQSNDNSNEAESKSFQTNQINIIPYDISLLSAVGELSTDEITNKVKETLLNNNIGQKLFGEAVLNLSQGTVSELLSKPKPR